MAELARRGGVLAVIGWARWPRRALDLFQILASTTDAELVVLMEVIGGPAGRIAWAEFGARRYAVTYGIEDRSVVVHPKRHGEWS